MPRCSTRPTPSDPCRCLLLRTAPRVQGLAAAAVAASPGHPVGLAAELLAHQTRIMWGGTAHRGCNRCAMWQLPAPFPSPLPPPHPPARCPRHRNDPPSSLTVRSLRCAPDHCAHELRRRALVVAVAVVVAVVAHPLISNIIVFTIIVFSSKENIPLGNISLVKPAPRLYLHGLHPGCIFTHEGWHHNPRRPPLPPSAIVALCTPQTCHRGK